MGPVYLTGGSLCHSSVLRLVLVINYFFLLVGKYVLSLRSGQAIKIGINMFQMQKWMSRMHTWVGAR
jgi:hypothetical protein